RFDQADPRLRALVEAELGGGVDLVIDDASHLYHASKTSFEALFPLLPSGGVYILEDWAWEHWPETHDPRHAFAREESLTRLVSELAEPTGSPKTLIAGISVFEGFVAIERGPGAVAARERFRVDEQIVRRPGRAPSRADDDVRLVAFHLPQFHPIPENDR